MIQELRKNERDHPARKLGSLRYCRKYMNDKVRVWAKTPKGKANIRRKTKKRKTAGKDLMWAAKSNPCMDCKGEFPPYAMEFDHVRGKKAFTISEMRHLSLGTLAVEIAKCDVVCATCHKIRTYERAH